MTITSEDAATARGDKAAMQSLYETISALPELNSEQIFQLGLASSALQRSIDRPGSSILRDEALQRFDYVVAVMTDHG